MSKLKLMKQVPAYIPKFLEKMEDVKIRDSLREIKKMLVILNDIGEIIRYGY